MGKNKSLREKGIPYGGWLLRQIQDKGEWQTYSNSTRNFVEIYYNEVTKFKISGRVMSTVFHVEEGGTSGTFHTEQTETWGCSPGEEEDPATGLE